MAKKKVRKLGRKGKPRLKKTVPVHKSEYRHVFSLQSRRAQEQDLKRTSSKVLRGNENEIPEADLKNLTRKYDWGE